MKKKLSFLLIALGFLSLQVHAFQTGGSQENPFSVWYEEGPVSLDKTQDFEYRILFQIPEDYYLYEDKLKIKIDETSLVELISVEKPKPIEKFDPFFKKIVPIYYNEIEVVLHLKFKDQKDAATLTGDIQFQGCSTELCYRLMHVPLEASFVLKNPSQEIQKKKSEGFFLTIKKFLNASHFDQIAEAGLGLAIFIAFIGGFLTDFTPCVLPMIPVTLAVIGVRKEKKPLKNILAVFVMVLGMSVMYSLLGLMAAFLGKSLGFLFQSIFFLFFVEIFIVLMALSLLGLFHIQLPQSLQTKLSSLSSAGYRGVFLVGLTMGLLAAPCVGPVVGPLLVYVAHTKSLFTGFILLLSYALGMGILFLVLGSLYSYSRIKIKTGVWTLWFKKALGVCMLLVAFYYGQTLYAQINPEKSENGYWISSLDEGLKKAKDQSKPLIVDFFAQWCPPCLELDHKVWSKPKVIREISKNWIAVKIDCTLETQICKEAVNRFEIIGWPTIVFLDNQQKEVLEKRLVGKVVSSQTMIQILESIRK